MNNIEKIIKLKELKSELKSTQKDIASGVFYTTFSSVGLTVQIMSTIIAFIKDGTSSNKISNIFGCGFFLYCTALNAFMLHKNSKAFSAQLDELDVISGSIGIDSTNTESSHQKTR